MDTFTVETLKDDRENRIWHSFTVEAENDVHAVREALAIAERDGYVEAVRCLVWLWRFNVRKDGKVTRFSGDIQRDLISQIHAERVAKWVEEKKAEKVSA